MKVKDMLKCRSWVVRCQAYHRQFNTTPVWWKGDVNSFQRFMTGVVIMHNMAEALGAQSVCCNE